MSQTILTLVPPSGDGSGPSVAIPVSDDFKTFQVAGTFSADHAALEVSQDGVNWDTIADVLGSNQAPVNVQFSAANARLRMFGFRSGTPVARLGVETLSVAALFTVAVTIPGSGSGVAASVAGFGRRKTFILNGGTTANANAKLNIEASMDGGTTFTGIGTMQGGVMVDAVPLVIEGIWTHVRVTVVQGDTTGLTLAVVADPTSADLGQPVSIFKWSGRHIGAAGVATSFVADNGVDLLQPSLGDDFRTLSFSGRHAGGAGAATNPVADMGVDATTVLLTAAPNYVMGACVARNLRVKPAVNTAAAATTIAVFKNGVATAITVNVGAGSVALVSDLANTASFAAGDLLDIVASSNAAGAGNNVTFSATLEIVSSVALATGPQYVTAAGVARNLRVKPVVNTLGQPCNVTVFKNGVTSGITVAIPAGSTAIISDLANTASFAAGDRIDVQADSEAAGAGTNLTFSATLEFVPVQV